MIAYHDYEGIALNLDERRLINDLGDKYLILKNHGLLTTEPHAEMLGSDYFS